MIVRPAGQMGVGRSYRRVMETISSQNDCLTQMGYFARALQSNVTCPNLCRKRQ